MKAMEEGHPEVAEVFLDVLRQPDRVGHAHDLLAEIEPRLAHVEDDGLGPGELDELQRGQADRTRADD